MLRRFFLCGDSDDITRVMILTIFESAILAGIQFLLYAAKWKALDYFDRSLQFYHVRGSTLFPLPTALVIILSHFGSYKAAESVHMDPALVTLAYHRVTEID